MEAHREARLEKAWRSNEDECGSTCENTGEIPLTNPPGPKQTRIPCPSAIHQGTTAHQLTQFKYDMPLAEHPLGTVLPKATGKLEVFKVEEPIREALHQPKDITRVLNDWITTDKAQLGLHVCTFKDATFVTLTWIHLLLDAMGRSVLLKAWTAMLEGREDDVPEFHGYDTDPLKNLGASPSTLAALGLSPKIEESVLKSKQLGGLAMAKFVYNYMWEIVFHPREHGRIICMPASYLSTLRARCLKDLDTLDPSLLTTNSSTGRPFLSDGDILCAWTTRLLARANPTLLTASAATRTMHVMNVLGMRDLLSSATDGYAALLPSSKEAVYIANCTSAIASLFTMQDFLTLPLGHIAAHLRRDLSVQATRAQVEASQRLACANGAYAQGMVGTGDMVLSAFTNWTKAKLFEADFSAAVAREAEGKEKGRRGRPVYIHSDPNRGKGFEMVVLWV